MAGRWIPKLILAGLGGLILVVAPLVAFFIDQSLHEGRVARNVVLDGVPVGGLPLTELAATLAETAGEYAARPLVIEFDDLEIRSTAGEYGFGLDVDATLAAVEAVDAANGGWSQFTGWVARLRRPATVGSLFVVDTSVARRSLNQQADDLAIEPSEPSITFDGEGLVLDPGDAGREVNVDATLEAMVSSEALEGIPGVWRSIPPSVSRGEVIALFTGLKRRIDAGLILFSDGVEEFVSPATFASWITVQAVGGGLTVQFAETEMHRTIEERFLGYAQGSLAYAYDVVDGVPVVIEVSDTRLLCCDLGVVELLKAVAVGNDDGLIELPLRRATEDERAASIEVLGIAEAIGTFTTFHRCCESRVTNIHRIADLTRGVVIGPGESFSVNEFVGRRTSENGFVEGGVIYQRRFESDIGGGVSQYATTLFNAAYFGGLEMPIYQSHSLYLDRYPYGREATLSFPVPDLVIHNPTPFAVLLWPTYSDTSITVTLYSTPSAVVTETGQAVDQWRSCTRVTTYRLREYPDGRRIEDAVYAFYRPSAGYACDGLPIDEESSDG